MQSVEERQLELEKEMAVMRELLERNLINDSDFQKEIRSTLSYLKERNTKVDTFIESEMQLRKDKAEFWKDQRSKLATSTLWGAFVITMYVLWYGASHWVQSVGK